MLKTTKLSKHLVKFHARGGTGVSASSRRAREKRSELSISVLLACVGAGGDRNHNVEAPAFRTNLGSGILCGSTVLLNKKVTRTAKAALGGRGAALGQTVLLWGCCSAQPRSSLSSIRQHQQNHPCRVCIRVPCWGRSVPVQGELPGRGDQHLPPHPKSSNNWEFSE